MARIRSIHPGIFSDPEFASLSDAAQIFYLGLLTEADDNGVFDWNPAKLRIRLRPGKDGAVDALLSELVASDKVRSYELDGRKHGVVRNFRKFQRPKKPKSWFVIPPEFRTYAGLDEASSELSPQREEEGGKIDSSEAKASDDEPSIGGDLASKIFGEGLKWLQSSSQKPRDKCASELGKLRRKLGDEGLIAALGKAQRENPIDPFGYLEGIARASAKPKPGTVFNG